MAGAAGSGSEVVKRLRLRPGSGRPHLVIGTVGAERRRVAACDTRLAAAASVLQVPVPGVGVETAALAFTPFQESTKGEVA